MSSLLVKLQYKLKYWCKLVVYSKFTTFILKVYLRVYFYILESGPIYSQGVLK